jgi:CheY-like chemotaxis protein
MLGIKAEIIHKGCGESFSKELETEEFSLIISDLYLIDGRTIIRNLRQGHYGTINKKTPAVAYTSFNSSAKELALCGFQEYILIPDFKNQLREIFKDLD